MITTYECEYCANQNSPGYRDALVCQRHEYECNYNPTNKTCSTCKHLDYAPNDEWGEDELGCLIFKDTKFRKQCDKWVNAKSPNEKS